MATTLYLAELVAYDPSTASVTTLRYASGPGFVTTAAETPANTWYDGRIKQAVTIGRHLFGSGKLSGRSRVSYGDLVLWNPDGALDALLGYGLAGRAVTIRRGEVGDAYPSGFVTLFTGTMEQADVIGDTLVIRMRDKQADLDVPLQSVKYAGSNALPAGLEGVANDLQGKPKPVCLGQVLNVPPPCVNTARLIYQVADRAVTVDAAYDSGVPLLAGFPLTSRTSGFGTSNVIAVAYGNGVFVAVGNDGKLASSDDGGTTWTLRTSGFSTSYISAVAYGDGQFVAVGENGKVSTSPDGFTWTAQTSGTPAWIKGIARGNGLWVLGASGGVIRTSPDAVTWTARTSGITDAIYGLAFGNGRFVAVGDNAACTVSQDGVTWAPVDTGSSATFLYDVAYAGNLFLAAGAGGIVLTSPDGVSWTDRDVGLGSVNLYGAHAAVTLDGQGFTYVVVGTGGRVASSPDGVTWTTETSGVAATVALWGITFGDGRYVAVGSNGTIYSSGVGTAYASLTQLLDDDETPNAGSVRVYSGTEGTYLRLGASPAGQITVDATEGATAAARTAGQLFLKVLQRAGKVSGDWNASDITTLDTAASAVCGYWTAEETTCAEVLDLITGSVWAWWGPGRDGTYRVQQLTAPSGTASLTVTANDILRPLHRLSVTDETKGLPSWRSIVRYGRNYAVQPGAGAAGSGSASTGSSGGGLGQQTNNNPVLATGATVPRTLQDRFAVIYDPEDFGAAGDGTTDDSTAIDAAVQAAITQRGAVAFRAAAYRMDTALTIAAGPVTLCLGDTTIIADNGFATITADGVVIEGRDRMASRIIRTAAWHGTNDVVMVDVQGVDGFTLRRCGFTLIMTGSTVAADSYALPLLIRDNTAHDTGSTNWTVEANDFEVTGSEPSTGNKMFGMLAWTRTAAPPRLTMNGRIHGNSVRNTEGRCIELALCENVAITGNTIVNGGDTASLVAVGVRVIGSRNIAVTGNTVDITGTSLANSDCLQVNGDNISENVTFGGNALRSSAGAGTGIKIGANGSLVTISGNDIQYDGAATSNMYGVLITTNPSDTPPENILVAGNRISGFNAQLGIARATVGDSFPSDVYFTNNLLGPRWDGTAAIGNFYNFSTVDTEANRIVTRGNLLLGSVENREERLQGDLVIPQASQLKARNVAGTGDIVLAWLTAADIVQLGGTGAVEVQVTNGTDVIRFPSGGHWRPAADNTQDLGASSLRWNQLWLGGDIEEAAGGFRQTIDNWTQENVAASQTNVELTRATGRFRAVRAGSVTGIIATMTEARTAGTLTVTVYKNTGLAGAAGASIGLTAVIDGTNTSRKATTQAKDTDTFVAGDEIYAVVTTDGSWTPTTSDLRVALEIED